MTGVTVAVLAIGLFAAGIGTMVFLRGALQGNLDSQVQQLSSADVANTLFDAEISGATTTFTPSSTAAVVDYFVPIYSPDFPQHSAADHAAQGADVVLYYGLAHIAAKAGMLEAYEVLKKNASTVSIENKLSVSGFDEFLGIEDARVQARKYGLINQNDDSMNEMARAFQAAQK